MSVLWQASCPVRSSASLTFLCELVLPCERRCLRERQPRGPRWWGVTVLWALKHVAGTSRAAAVLGDKAALSAPGGVPQLPASHPRGKLAQNARWLQDLARKWQRACSEPAAGLCGARSPTAF